MRALLRQSNCSQYAGHIVDIDDPLFGLYRFEEYKTGAPVAPPPRELRNMPMTCSIEVVRTARDMYGALVSMGDHHNGFAAWMCHAGCVHVFAGEHSIRYGVSHSAKVHWEKDHARIVIAIIPGDGSVSIFMDHDDASSEQALNWSFGDEGFTNNVLGTVGDVTPALTASAPTELQTSLHGGYVDSVKFFYNQRPRMI